MIEKSRILVVEDQEFERSAMERVLRVAHYDVVAVASTEEALEWTDQDIDVVISDLRMGGQSGIDLLMQWREIRPETPFILATAYGDVDSAVRAMKLGASEYLTKPLDPPQLLDSLHQLLTKPPVAASTIKPTPLRGFGPLIGRSRLMLDVFDRIRRAAQTDSIVLILGESGTGKELVAGAIHRESPRAKAPYVAVNMAAIPAHLVESELFGHVRGAFTGAIDTRVGRFQVANGGTIFIDEIGDFESTAQAKLLRVLENYTVCPVGCNDDIRVDVRVVAATSRNLQELVEKGQFREDLFYRLNVVLIRLPPLRDRPEDIPLLADLFLSESAKACSRQQMSIDSELMHHFMRHAWPGNVRQLRNLIFSMVVMTEKNELSLTDLPVEQQKRGLGTLAASTAGATQDLEAVERTHILATLENHAGNRTHSAAVLRISVRTLQRKLKAWGLEHYLQRELVVDTSANSPRE